jgi:ribosomal protein S18 acetylase RimI-like enzyme
MRVEQATSAHLTEIRSAYADGRATQRATRSPIWPEFTDAAILAEIDSGALHRVVDGDSLVGVFSAIYDDSAIWGELERHAHIYLHRIARASSYPGRGLVDAVLDWSLAQCQALGREGLRMDTWASNDALIAYYGKRGFRPVGTKKIPMDSPMSEHYRGIELALLERPVMPERRSRREEAD